MVLYFSASDFFRVRAKMSQLEASARGYHAQYLCRSDEGSFNKLSQVLCERIGSKKLCAV